MTGRDEDGKFKKGMSGNPAGRPRKEREERFYEITASSVTFQDWKEIIQKAVSQAKRGDTAARKFLADYLMGVPIQKIAPVTPDGENPYMSMSREELIELAKQIADAGNAE